MQTLNRTTMILDGSTTSGPDGGTEKEVVILLSDMVRYTQITEDMRPHEIRDFIVEYHRNLQKIIQVDECLQEIEPSAGDGAIAIFERREGECGKSGMCIRALQAAINIACAVEDGLIPPTRIGLFLGDIVEVLLGGKTMRFGASFAVSRRLEELCGYFGTTFLMDKEVAFWQTDESGSLVCIGKVTPKNFNHPIHVYSLYKPGIHGCSRDLDPGMIQQFISMKNRAIELFCGNSLQGIRPDFPMAREKLEEAQRFFVEMTGREDIASDRILTYIRNMPYPSEDFRKIGMKVNETTGESMGTRILHLSNELLRAMDLEFYQALVVDTDWERHFKLEWRKKGDVLMRINEPPNGVYYLDSGSVNALDENGNLVATLVAGNVFGEMAYFTRKKRRNATIIANTDVVVRRISSEKLNMLPVIKKIFRKIAGKRKRQAL
ncbi:MAG: cyclic nucleotide-binding domain-containing protein [Desulfocapsaceae bacterium]|nr:cyclic nucleotide-binding domain-containing protein [Desulfocapsaceae bacterium]